MPPDLRLRGERPRVTRLSRKVLVGMGFISALAVAGALGYALQTRNKAGGGQELLKHSDRTVFGGRPRGPAKGLYWPATPGAAARAAAARRSRPADPQRRRSAEHG